MVMRLLGGMELVIRIWAEGEKNLRTHYAEWQKKWG
jgi:hypothetical protein